MSGMHQALLMAGAASGVADNIVSVSTLPSSSFTTNSVTYVDLLDATAGSAISVSFTKASATSNVWAWGCASGVATGADCVVTLGCNDGTTDRDLGRALTQTAYYGLATGGIIITGLAAGSYTFKLRVKVSGNTFNFNTGACSASLTVAEVDP